MSDLERFLLDPRPRDYSVSLDVAPVTPPPDVPVAAPLPSLDSSSELPVDESDNDGMTHTYTCCIYM